MLCIFQFGQSILELPVLTNIKYFRPIKNNSNKSLLHIFQSPQHFKQLLLTTSSTGANKFLCGNFTLGLSADLCSKAAIKSKAQRC